MKRFRMRDDVRKAMFANINGANRFAKGSDGTEIYSSSFKVKADASKPILEYVSTPEVTKRTIGMETPPKVEIPVDDTKKGEDEIKEEPIHSTTITYGEKDTSVPTHGYTIDDFGNIEDIISSKDEVPITYGKGTQKRVYTGPGWEMNLPNEPPWVPPVDIFREYYVQQGVEGGPTVGEPGGALLEEEIAKGSLSLVDSYKLAQSSIKSRMGEVTQALLNEPIVASVSDEQIMVLNHELSSVDGEIEFMNNSISQAQKLLNTIPQDSRDTVGVKLSNELSDMIKQRTKLTARKKILEVSLNPAEARKERVTGYTSELTSLKEQLKLFEDLEAKERTKTWGGAVGYGFEKGSESSFLGVGKELGALPVRVAKDVVMSPGRAVTGAAGLAKGGLGYIGKVGTTVAAPAALAFGEAAGVGVSKIIGEGYDLIEGPQKEFWVPPGYQKVWNGTSYEYKPVARYPMEPWYVNKSMGVGMPPGLQPRYEQQLTMPVSDARYVGNQFIPKEKGYGGADTSYDTRFLGGIPAEELPPSFKTPKIIVPDYYHMGGAMSWIIPPKELIYAKKVQPRVAPVARPTYLPAVSGVVAASVPVPVRGYAAKLAEPVPSLDEMRLPTKLTPSKIPKAREEALKSDARPQKLKSISRSVYGAMKGAEDYESVVERSGKESPEAVKAQARLQTKLDYAVRKNEPGTFGRYALEQKGLVGEI